MAPQDVVERGLTELQAKLANLILGLKTGGGAGGGAGGGDADIIPNDVAAGAQAGGWDSGNNAWGGGGGGGGGGGLGFDVARTGIASVGFVGFPSVGKVCFYHHYLS